MRTLVVLNDPAYGTERSHNGLRGAEVGLCGTCMDARGISEDRLVEGARRASLEELTDWTLWADKVVAF